MTEGFLNPWDRVRGLSCVDCKYYCHTTQHGYGDVNLFYCSALDCHFDLYETEACPSWQESLRRKVEKLLNDSDEE